MFIATLHEILVMIIIGITDCSKYTNYEQWLAGESVKVVKLSSSLRNAAAVADCHGIVISGGEDVHPRYYQKLEYLPYCHEIDEARDEFELEVIDRSQTLALPLLGICRGLQIANVYFGGTLIPDLPSFGKFNHSRGDNKDREHSILVDSSSELYRIAGVGAGIVNSAHHQSAELIGKGLVTNCLSPDGVIEGLEWRDPKDKAFLQLVQWHPERMLDQHSSFSSAIRSAFISALKRL